MGEAHLNCVALDRQKYMSLILSIRSGLAICVALLALAARSRQGPQGDDLRVAVFRDDKVVELAMKFTGF